jgi:thiamine biosynthesis protein ThiS
MQVGLMRVTVNGESRSFAGPLALDGLLAALGLEARKIAIERNREIVPKSRYAETTLADGDQIEIVTFVGGG